MSPPTQPPPVNKEPGQSSMSEQKKEDDYWPISAGKPYFSVVLPRTSSKDLYQLTIPTRVYPQLPCARLPTVITHGGKKWDMVYHGDVYPRKFANSGWKKLVEDNNLKGGDGCVFELEKQTHSMLKFKVQFLRSNFPAELKEKAEGLTESKPIII